MNREEFVAYIRRLIDSCVEQSSDQQLLEFYNRLVEDGWEMPFKLEGGLFVEDD